MRARQGEDETRVERELVQASATRGHGTFKAGEAKSKGSEQMGAKTVLSPLIGWSEAIAVSEWGSLSAKRAKRSKEIPVSKAKRRSAAIESVCMLQAQCSELVETYMPLVRQIARRYSQFNPDSLEDLIQVGAIGLLKAIRYYDPNRPRSASFKTLATCYIRGEIRHYLRDHCSLVQVPRRLAEVTTQLSQLEEKLTHQLDHTPTVQELASYSGLSVQEILEAQLSWEARLHYESFDSAGEDEDRDDKRSLSDMVPDRKYQELQRVREERELVTQALQRLGERSRRILEFVFFYDLSQKETASVLGLSEMGVSRALHSGLKKLKEIIATDARS
jgi:RNA polymerase sigma-B factor